MDHHNPRFVSLVDDARARVRECTVEDVWLRMSRREQFNLIDVREESEYANGHLPAARHLGKGIIERDIETEFPDFGTELVLYCGGGYRSVLAADNLRRMGYGNAISMDGGIRGWTEAGYPVES